MYSYTVSRDESRSPTDFLDLSDDLEGMMTNSYEDCCTEDQDILKDKNCLRVRTHILLF